MTGPGWTKATDLVAVLRRRWGSGRYLRAYARGEGWEPVVLPVKGPNADELLHRFEEVRKWVAAFQAGADRSLQIEYRTVGGRHVGANRIPARVRVPDFASLCSVLGTAGEVRVLDQLMARTKSEMPLLAAWSADHPLVLLEHRDVWSRVLATTQWIAGRDTQRTYVRQIDVEGVDTKFVERHQKLLSEVLPLVLSPERVELSEVEFARRFRFLNKPLYTRFRILDPSLSPFPPGVSEVSLRTEELADLDIGAATVFVVENEVTYLAIPPVPRGVAVFGSGFAFGRTGRPALAVGSRSRLLGRHRHLRLRDPEPPAQLSAAGSVRSHGPRDAAFPPGPLGRREQPHPPTACPSHRGRAVPLPGSDQRRLRHRGAVGTGASEVLAGARRPNGMDRGNTCQLSSGALRLNPARNGRSHDADSAHDRSPNPNGARGGPRPRQDDPVDVAGWGVQR